MRRDAPREPQDVHGWVWCQVCGRDGKLMVTLDLNRIYIAAGACGVSPEEILSRSGGFWTLLRRESGAPECAAARTPGGTRGVEVS